MGGKLETRLLLCALASLTVSAVLGARWEDRLRFYPADGILTSEWEPGRFEKAKFRPSEEVLGKRPRRPKAAPPATASRPNSKTWQRLSEEDGMVKAEYGFLNFNNDSLHIDYTVSSADLARYRQGYGYTDGDLGDIKVWYKKTMDDAYVYATKHRQKQAQYDATAAAINTEYERRQNQLWIDRGFKVIKGNVLTVDIPAVTKRNVSNLKPVAISLNSIAEQMEYDPDTMLNAAVALVQTAVQYKIPPDISEGRHTGGILPPVETIARGWGDCDTKTALLASILGNWDGIKLLGVSIPHHYLMAMLRAPGKGDLFVEYQGMKYVLVEPAGPAWLQPGQVGDNTMDYIKSNESFEMEPLNF